MFSAIIALDLNNGIGLKNSLPWKIKNDIIFFKEKTLNNIVIMGRKTWDSIKNKPLKNRINIILTKNNKYKSSENNVLYFNCVYKLIDELKKKKYENKKKFIIGGKSIYDFFLRNNFIYEFFVTKINKTYECDLYFDIYKYQNNFDEKLINNTNNLYNIYKWTYVNNEEIKINKLIKKILFEGELRNNRTNIKTFSIFGEELSFSLKNNTFPLITSRKLPLRMIFEELMWNIRGQTNSKILEKKNIFIWKGNTTKEFLKKRNLEHYNEGDIGPSYGFLLRHFSAKYKGCNENYKNEGFDQLKYVINKLKNNKTDRRIILNLWDCSKFDEMTLPPCSFNYQFYVKNKKYLICKLTQRSSDFCLAGGWNIAYAALFTFLLANHCDLIPEKIIFSLGDTHIYENHIENAKILMNRQPFPFPQLIINKKRKNIENYEFKDLTLLNYNYHSTLNFPMNT